MDTFNVMDTMYFPLKWVDVANEHSFEIKIQFTK